MKQVVIGAFVALFAGAFGVPALAQVPSFSPGQVLTASELNQAFQAVCPLSGCIYTGAVTLGSGATVSGGKSVDTLSVSGNSFFIGTLAAGAINATSGASITGGLTADTLHATGAATLSGGATVSNGLATDTETASGLITAGSFKATGSNPSVTTSQGLSLGTGVAANGTVTISTPNGSNINLNPQGTAHVKIASAPAR